MEIKDLTSTLGEWLRGGGPESDIVVSSRIRLARNAAGYPFLNRASLQQRSEIEALLVERLGALKAVPDLSYRSLVGTAPLDRQILVERHLISREHSEGKGSRGVAVGRQESVAIMVNEEDHLRIQVIRAGLQMKEAWEAMARIDDEVERKIRYAYSQRFGFLTACPTNVGTGLRASVMVHLPGLVITKQIEKVFTAVSKINLAVRGLYGEGTKASGDFYQISNQITLGKTEQEILENIESVIPRIVLYERKAREELGAPENRRVLEDKVFRAYGTLLYARVIASEETLYWLSLLRLGVALGILEGLKMRTVNELFLLTQPAHLQRILGRTMEQDERRVARADFIRKRLEEAR